MGGCFLGTGRFSYVSEDSTRCPLQSFLPLLCQHQKRISTAIGVRIQDLFFFEQKKNAPDLVDHQETDEPQTQQQE